MKKLIISLFIIACLVAWPSYGNNTTNNDVKEEKEVVDQMPTFPGGYAELMRYLKFSLKYPTIAQEQGIQGIVIVKFVVTDNGQIANVSILHGVDPHLDKEAMRIVMNMPRWEPGKLDGKPINVSYTLPLTFKLM